MRKLLAYFHIFNRIDRISIFFKHFQIEVGANLLGLGVADPLNGMRMPPLGCISPFRADQITNDVIFFLVVLTVDQGSAVVDIDTILALLAQTSTAERSRFLAALVCDTDGATRPLLQHQVAVSAATSVGAMRAALGRACHAFQTA